MNSDLTRSDLFPRAFDLLTRDLFEPRTLSQWLNDRVVSERGSKEFWINPSLELIENEKDYLVRVELPGVKSEDVQVEIDGQLLTISGEKRSEASTELPSGVHHTERRYGSFRRQIQLPKGLKLDSLGAEFKDGLLTVRVAKAEESKPRRVEIKNS